MTNLPGFGVEQVKHTMEYHWMNAHFAPILARQLDDVVSPALYGSNEPERATARALLVRKANAIRKFISNKRQGPAEENGDQQARTSRPGWLGAIVVVDHFRNDQILKEMHSLVAIALSRNAPGFGRCVNVERGDAPSLRHAFSRLRCQDFGCRVDRSHRDAKPPGELFLGEHPNHRSIRN